MQKNAALRGLMTFLKNSPSTFHAVANLQRELDEAGFTELPESQRWKLVPGGEYYVIRNGTSIVAFRVGTDLSDFGFTVTASHTDSPCFKMKENAELWVRDKYIQLNTESYGSMICSTWMDRPLGVAGRVLVRRRTEEGEFYENCLLDFNRDLVLIPNLAIHMNRRTNEGFAYNKQIDMVPLFSTGKLGKGAFRRMLSEQIGVAEEDIMGSDLYLYNRMPPTVWGAANEFLSAGRLDDLECAWGTLQGFLTASNERSIQVWCSFDNEEVGSKSKQGAGSTFFVDVLRRAVNSLGMDDEAYRCAIAKSLMFSCDNAHAVHPNHPEKTDATNCTYMNGGIVLKSHAGQKYTSDGISVGLAKGVCERAKVPVQYFSNRSDESGGFTLGNIAMTHVSMIAVDMGLPQLAMHSAYETAGVDDLEYLIRATQALYATHYTVRNGMLRAV